MDARELRHHLEALRDLRKYRDEVWIQDRPPHGRWFAVSFAGMADEPGTVMVEDPLYLNPRKDKPVHASDVRLSNPDEQVRIRRPVRIRRAKGVR